MSEDDRDDELREALYRIVELQLGAEGLANVREGVEASDAFAERRQAAEDNSRHLPNTYDRRACLQYYISFHCLVAILEWFMVYKSDPNVGCNQ